MCCATFHTSRQAGSPLHDLDRIDRSLISNGLCDLSGVFTYLCRCWMKRGPVRQDAPRRPVHELVGTCRKVECCFSSWFLTSNDPSRRPGQEVSEVSRGESGRVKRCSKSQGSGRVGLGVFEPCGSGRVTVWPDPCREK